MVRKAAFVVFAARAAFVGIHPDTFPSRSVTVDSMPAAAGAKIRISDRKFTWESVSVTAGRKSLAQLRHVESATPGALALVNVEFTGAEARNALGLADYPNAHRLASQAIEALQKVPPGSAH